MRKSFALVITTLAVSMLAACGGGGDAGNVQPLAVKAQPQVTVNMTDQAKPDVTVNMTDSYSPAVNEALAANRAKADSPGHILIDSAKARPDALFIGSMDTVKAKPDVTVNMTDSAILVPNSAILVPNSAILVPNAVFVGAFD